jgi:predicted HicB family RNase H-like nuclease
MSEEIQLTFKNEDEEAQWWYDNREERDAAMLAAIENGTARRSKPAERVAAAKTTVRLDPEDVKLASELAMRRGVEVGTYVRQIFHEALERERSLVA